MAMNSKWAVRLPGIVIVLAALTVCTTSAQTAATGKSFLWKVHSGQKVLYLAGSVHALGADAYPLSAAYELSLIHISEPTRLLSISYAVFCLKKKKNKS